MNLDILVPLQDAAFATQTAAYTGSAAAATGWKPGPKAVWLFATTDCYVRVGESVTATSADFFLPAAIPVKLAVPDGTGATWTVSAIRVATSGTLYAKPLQH